MWKNSRKSRSKENDRISEKPDAAPSIESSSAHVQVAYKRRRHSEEILEWNNGAKWGCTWTDVVAQRLQEAVSRREQKEPTEASSQIPQHSSTISVYQMMLTSFFQQQAIDFEFD